MNELSTRAAEQEIDNERLKEDLQHAETQLVRGDWRQCVHIAYSAHFPPLAGMQASTSAALRATSDDLEHTKVELQHARDRCTEAEATAANSQLELATLRKARSNVSNAALVCACVFVIGEMHFGKRVVCSWM